MVIEIENWIVGRVLQLRAQCGPDEKIVPVNGVLTIVKKNKFDMWKERVWAKINHRGS